MVPLTTKVPVPFEYVFPHGVLFLGVEPVRDFEAKGDDKQARDKESKLRLWQVRVLDLDPEAGRFGSSKEVKVKIAAEHQPVPPAPDAPGYPPMVAFNNVTITPYVDSSRRCGERCRARLAWSVRAESMSAVSAVVEGSGGRSVRAAA